MRIFVVTILAGEEAYQLATSIVRKAGAESYADADEFRWDGVQDPLRAVAEADALIWIYAPPSHYNDVILGKTDYNYLYADTVMLNAVTLGKPVLYYQLARSKDLTTSPALLSQLARRTHVQTLDELRGPLEQDLEDLLNGRIEVRKPRAPSVFLSHNHKDKPFARRLAQDLERAGAKVWIDERDIQVGDSLIETIRHAIDHTDYFAVILSPDSVESRWVRTELDVAMNMEIDNKSIKVLPLVYRQCELPGFLKGKYYADFTGDYQHGLSLVLRRLGLAVLGGRSN